MSISDYINKHRQAGTLGQKVPAPSGVVPESAGQTTPMVRPFSPVPQRLTNAQKIAEDRKRGVTISAAPPEKPSILRQLARKLPFGFEENVFDPLAKVGRFLAPSVKDYQMEVLTENPELSGKALEEAITKKITSGGDIPLIGPEGLRQDTTILGMPDIPATIKRIAGKAVQKGEQAVVKSTPATPAVPAIYQEGSRFAVDTTKVPMSEYIKKNLSGIGAQRKGNEKMLRAFYADQARRQETPKARLATEPAPTGLDARRATQAELSELEVEKAVLTDTLRNDPAGKLVSRMGRGDNSLAQLQENAIKRGGKTTRYDDLDEMGFKDMDDAQQAIEQYRLTRARLNQIEEQLKEVKARDRAAAKAEKAELNSLAQYADETPSMELPAPPGARTPRPPKPPSTTKTGKFRIPPPGTPKERKFVTSVKKKMPDAEPIQRINGQYVPRPTDELAIKARTLIEEDFAKADEMRKSDLGDTSVAIATEMIKALDRKIAATNDVAIKNSLLDDIVDIVEDMAPRLTEAGREIQAASILGRQTPAGFLRFANRQIAKENSKRAAGKQIPGLTKEESKELYEKAKRVFEMPEGDAKYKAIKELNEEVRKRIPSPWYNKLATFWKAGLLTGLKTTGLNLVSNVAHTGLEIAKDAPATAADIAISLFTGKRSKALTTKGWGKGFLEGGEKGWNYWKTGYDPREISRSLELKAVRFKSKVIQGYVDTVFRTLSATDQPLYYGALRRSLRDQAIVQAKNEKLKGEAFRKRVLELEEAPDEAMSAIATLDAETAVFVNKTTLGKVGKKIQEIPGGEFVVPFSRTPSSVAMQVLNYSPVGIMLEVRRQIARGTFDQRGLSTAIGRSVTGSVPIIWLGTELYDNDAISLDFPKTERERELWKAEGRVPNSIKIGNDWRTLQSIGPAGPVVLMGAHYAKALEETGSPSAAMILAFWGTAKSFSESTFLRGVNDILSALTNPAQEGTNWAAGYISSWIPTIINDVARSTDAKERFTSDQSFLKTVMNRVQSRIPGFRQGLEKQVDVIGRDVNRPAGAVANMIDPTRPSQIKDTPVVNEMRRLQDAGFDASPTRVGDKFGYDNLTPEQRTEMWQRAGELTNDKLSKLIALPAYQAADDEAKTKAVNKIVAQTQQLARAEMLLELTAGLEGEALIAELREAKAAGLLTEAVLKKYKELRANQ
jgi:hypothetical protein